MLALVVVLLLAAAGVAAGPSAGPAADLAGTWAGSVSHEGESTPFALELIPEGDGRLRLRLTIPVIHLIGQPLGSVPPQVEGERVKLGPFDLVHDRGDGSLRGVVPEGLAPHHRIPIVLRRVERLEVPARPEPGGSPARVAWVYEAGSALWSGPTWAGDTVYVGGQDGRVHAVEARTGARRWVFRAGGPVRTRPTAAEGAVYVQADDGFLYKLGAADGTEVWRVRVTEAPVERLPFDDPKSRYDRFGSDVVARDGRLHLGTHDGKVLAVDPSSGKVLWSFAAGDSVLAAPAVGSGRVYAGSFDGHLYALEAATGRLLWKLKTSGAIVSTPAVAGDRLVVGNRAYDLLAVDARTGQVAWTRYVWFSWVESTASVRDGVAYVGSSDAARVFAIDVASGRSLWSADVFGWAWGQPAVTDERVYVATSGQVGYPGGHRPGVMAVDRATGRTVWRHEAPSVASGPYGFPGSPAVGGDLVFASGLDGRLLAFPR